MATDASDRLPGRPPTDVNLPDVVSIEIRRIPYAPPTLRNFKSRLASYNEAVEFLVRTNGPIPVRAFGPALYVGDVPVTDSAKVEETLYRFLAFDFDALEPGAPISWGWMKDRPEWRQPTKYRYNL